MVIIQAIHFCFFFPTQTNRMADRWHNNNLASPMANQWPTINCTHHCQRWRQCHQQLAPQINRRENTKSITIDSTAMAVAAMAVAITRMAVDQIEMHPQRPLSINATFGHWHPANRTTEPSTRAARIWLHAQKVGRRYLLKRRRIKTHFLFNSFIVLFTRKLAIVSNDVANVRRGLFRIRFVLNK